MNEFSFTQRTKRGAKEERKLKRLGIKYSPRDPFQDLPSKAKFNTERESRE